MDIKIPLKVEKIINMLEEKGYEAFAVGGCIRDSVLGKVPKDWDITTSALPDEVRASFEKTYATGILHGTVTVLIDEEAFEVTTYRMEEGYTDCRHPDKVSFVRNLEEDLKRRDFTINAMAYNPNTGLVDLFGGLNDINKGIIRAVGQPEERFTEDALRILRAVRFAARLGFEIDPKTQDAIKKCAHLITKISHERIREELTGILMSQNPQYIQTIYELNVLTFILPDISKCFETSQNSPYHVYDVGRHTMEALKASERDFCVRWAVLLHDAGKAYTRTTDAKNIDHFYGHDKVSEEIAEKVLTEYKFDNYNKKIIKTLVKYHDRQIKPEDRQVRRAINNLGESTLRLLFLVKRADNAGKNPSKLEKAVSDIDKLEKMLNEIISKDECTSLKSLNITGDDLIELGIPAGPVIGDLLKELLERVMENPELNNKKMLIKEAKIKWNSLCTIPVEK